MSRPRVICLGCGDAWSARWYSTCFALEAEGRRLLIDCPHPIRKILRESTAAAGAPLDVADFEAVVLTHLHADHASGLEGWAYYFHYVLERRAVLLTHPEVKKSLWDHHLSGSMAGGGPTRRRLEDFFEVLSLSEAAPASIGPFSIECRRTCHPIPTFALRIVALGRTIGFSADTSFDPGLIEWLSSSDVIIHETNYGIHTPYEALAALPEALRARMRLVHYPDDFDVDGSVIRCFRQGESIEI